MKCDNNKIVKGKENREVVCTRDKDTNKDTYAATSSVGSTTHGKTFVIS